MPPHATLHRPTAARTPDTPADDTQPDGLAAQWNAALAGDAAARGRWTCTEGGEWAWDGGGVRVAHGPSDWHTLSSDLLTPADRMAMRRFRIEATVRGTGGAAGFSLGPWRDVLARLHPSGAPRQVALEADLDSGCWSVWVDGELQERTWWDGDLSAETLAQGQLHLKAFKPESVHVGGLSVRALPPVPCRLSVILTCHRFAQRLRVTLRGWCEQALPAGSYEVLVVNPGSPDATHAVLAAAERAYPHVRVREIATGGTRNKGEMINLAFARSRGEWIWLTDADCLFPIDAAARVLDHAAGMDGPALLYCERRYLSAVQTDSLLSGRVDGVARFGALAAACDSRGSDTTTWGYTQIVRRETLARHRYTRAMNHFAYSDNQFVDECRAAGVPMEPVPGLTCLHLDHPFAWYGTREML